MSGEDSRLRGRWGEALAAEFLRRKGYRIIASGWRCRFGELDLVAEGGEFLCFIEVKLRGSERFGTGASKWTAASRSGCGPRRSSTSSSTLRRSSPAST